ncbi:MAG: exosortase/archaeosortase family protein [Planctomycetota bacterium]|nr:MAG: exosortase/archaeosortase family protein [Planctomycetota bacterium]
MSDNIVSSGAKIQADYSQVREHSKIRPDRCCSKSRGATRGSGSEPSFGNNPQNPNIVSASWLELGVHNYVKMLIIGGLFIYLFRNEIYSIVVRWKEPSWSHGFLIPLFSLYFVHQAKSEILNLQTKPSYLGSFFLICGIVFYIFNIVSPAGYTYFRLISVVGTLGAVVLLLGGWALIKYTWLPIAFLVFAVPLPNRYYVSLTMPMRQLAAKVAAVLLNLVSEMEATASGVVIDVIYKGQRLDPPLNVAEACSGMRLLMAFLALGVAMAYLHYRPIWQRLVLLAGTIPIAVFCNIIRVTVTGFIYILIHPKYAHGIYHDILGLTMLPLAFGLYGFLAWFMSSLFVEETELAKDIVVRRQCKEN